MTGTLRSLRDWLADQVAEVRHLSPLAVLAPSSAPSHQTCAPGPSASSSATARRTPVAVPSLEDMPSTESEPACSGGRTVRTFESPCGQPAEWVIRAAHVTACRERRCDPPAHLLLCNFHFNDLHDHTSEQLPCWCDACGRNIDQVSDVVRSAVRL